MGRGPEASLLQGVHPYLGWAVREMPGSRDSATTFCCTIRMFEYMVIEGREGPTALTTRPDTVGGGEREKKRFSPSTQLVRGETKVQSLKWGSLY